MLNARLLNDITRNVRPLTSPRTLNTTLKRVVTNSPGEQAPLSIRECTDAIARNIKLTTTLARRFASTKSKKKGATQVVKIGDREYTREAYNQQVKELQQSVRSLPAAACSYKRNARHISDDERQKRIDAQVERSTPGIQALASELGIPKLAGYIQQRNLEVCTKSKKPPSRVESGTQISAAFYISDPLREFILNANLGNGIAYLFPNISDKVRSIVGGEDPEAAYAAVSQEIGKDPATVLGIPKKEVLKLADPRVVLRPLVLDLGIATSPLLMCIMAFYVSANDLRDENGRVHIDELMQTCFGKGNTRHVLFDKDVTSSELGDDVISTLTQSGLARLTSRAPKTEKSSIPCDGETFDRSMSIALASYYRIPATATHKETLQTPKVVNLANGIKAYFASHK